MGNKKIGLKLKLIYRAFISGLQVGQAVTHKST